MGLIDLAKRTFTKKEPEVYTPQREAIDRRHDALLRQRSFYEKKAQIPELEAEIKAYEKKVYGNGITTPDNQNIMKARNVFQDIDSGNIDNNGTILKPKVTEFDYESRTPIQKRNFSKQIARSEVQGMRDRRAEGKESRRALIQARMAMLAAKKKAYADRMKKRSQFESRQMKVQKAIAKALRFKSRSQEMSSLEYRRMYGQANSVNDGNLLHTPNMFAPQRYAPPISRGNASILGGSNILQAPNLVLGSSNNPRGERPRPLKIKWF